MLKDTVKKIPNWAMLLAFYVSILAASCFTTQASLSLIGQMMNARINVAMQVAMNLITAAVTLGIYELFNRVVYMAVQSFSRGGLECGKREFLRDIRMFQTAKFLLCAPTAVLSFFFPIWLGVFSVWNVLVTLLCYIGLYLYMEKSYLAYPARKRVLLVMMVPLLVYLFLTAVL